MRNKPLRAELQGDARIRTLCRRGVLRKVTTSPPVSIDRAFLRRFHARDKDAEIHFHAAAGKFVLYRRVSGLGREDSDLLIREMIFGENGTSRIPGDWLIGWMEWADKFANGAINPELARDNYLNGLEDHERDRLAQFDKDRMTMSEDVAKHLKWCIDGRCSVTVDRGKRRYA